MPPTETENNAKAAVTAVSSLNVQSNLAAAVRAGAVQQSSAAGLAAAPAAPITKQARLSGILKGIAAIAAELGPDFIHSSEGTSFLGVGELALQLLGDFV